MLIAKREEFRTINFEETELRLGLPGNNHEAGGEPAAKKRGFSETETFGETGVDLKLNLSVDSEIASAVSATAGDLKLKNEVAVDHAKPPAKAQVVGWPPVRSFRKNIMSVQKRSSDEPTVDQKAATSGSGAYVKVSMDGAPYLRKVDLNLYPTYKELSGALAKMFSSFTIGSCGSQGAKDFMNESKLIDLLNGSEYVATYEDKDGDWMLVGDVPWEMFVSSCKRLRIMQGSEAIGLAPRTVEKCKGR